MRIIAKAPFATVGELERAGAWLAQQAEPRDGFLQERMALRWRDACRASLTLGAEATHMYQTWLPHIDPAAEPNDFKFE